MAASCRRVVRSTVQGLCYLSTRSPCLKTPLVQSISSLRPQECVLQHRALHFSHHPSLSIRTEPQKTTDAPKATETVKNTNDQKKTDDDEGKDNYGPEYIPRRKAKNPMMIIGYAWIIGLPTGVIGFILAKNQVDKNRLKQLKIRQRMKKANEGEYESERFKTATRME